MDSKCINNLIQAEDRIHRIGQKNCVLSTYIIGKQTIDEWMLITLENKMKIVGKILDNFETEMDVQML